MLVVRLEYNYRFGFESKCSTLGKCEILHLLVNTRMTIAEHNVSKLN